MSSRADVKDLTNHAVKNEPGTLVYVPTQDPKDPNKITIWEEVSVSPFGGPRGIAAHRCPDS
jgi:hypothetical protein